MDAYVVLLVQDVGPHDSSFVEDDPLEMSDSQVLPPSNSTENAECSLPLCTDASAGNMTPSSTPYYCTDENTPLKSDFEADMQVCDTCTMQAVLRITFLLSFSRQRSSSCDYFHSGSPAWSC